MTTPPRVILPPPEVPITDASGRMTKEWLAWFAAVTRKLNGI